MQELYLIRHGESEHLVKGLTGGWTNTPLTDLGREQAYLTGQRLKDLIQDSSFGFFSSDLERASQTAQIIGSILEVVPILDEALRDLNWGVVTGMPLKEAREFELEKTEPLFEWIPFPAAENWRMLHERIAPFLEQIDKKEYDTVLIVSHGNPIEECIYWWLDFSLEMRREISFDIAQCSITHLRVNNWGQKTIGFLNRIEHLHSLSS
ncbi:MAG: histidine phosphatase family protein [Candidatus Thorarchaeota archaeon]